MPYSKNELLNPLTLYNGNKNEFKNKETDSHPLLIKEKNKP